LLVILRNYAPTLISIDVRRFSTLDFTHHAEGNSVARPSQPASIFASSTPSIADYYFAQQDQSCY
jgi:hypothetical protein